MELTLPDGLVAELAQRRCRLHLYTWHRLRHSWFRLTESERRAVEVIDPRWVPPRPALDSCSRPLPDNNSGADFLFKNRQMILWATRALARDGAESATRVAGWRRVPPPGDPDYPVPNFPDSGLERLKSDDYYEKYLALWERLYTDENYLRRVSLGRLGSEIEFTISNDMHLRWAAPSRVGYRPTTAIAQRIERHWDALEYDYLGDIYASHVNPLFWELRGWVDDRLEDWKRVHGIVGDVKWVKAWTTPGPCGDGAVEAAERIDRIISESGAGVVDGFLRPDPERD